VEKREFPWHEVQANLVPSGVPLEQIKAWRTKEAAAGRPSGYEDWCRANGRCVICNSEGITHNDDGIGFKVVGMDGDVRLFERCPVRDGTGIQLTSER
jgi:hypothetical protein